MAKSRYEYVKQFELPDPCLPNTFMVVRVDGRGFTKFTKLHAFAKPNDDRALRLMNACASHVMKEYNDIVCAIGMSDEFSFVIRRDSNLYNRRESKIMSSIVSCFSSAYACFWSVHFPQTPLKTVPLFDGRLVCYPTEQNLRDYMSWRQVDCHINNLYNTCFWKLCESGMSNSGAEELLAKTVSSQKHELLHARFGINYAELPAMHRKGTVVVRSIGDRGGEKKKPAQSEESTPEEKKKVGQEMEKESSREKTSKRRQKWIIAELHEDVIGDAFWEKYPWILRPMSLAKARAFVNKSST